MQTVTPSDGVLSGPLTHLTWEHREKGILRQSKKWLLCLLSGNK